MRSKRQFTCCYGSNGALHIPKSIGACTASVTFTDVSIVITLKRRIGLSNIINVTGAWQKDVFPKGTTGYVSRQSGSAYRAMYLPFALTPSGSWVCILPRNTDHYYAHRTTQSKIKDGD